MLSNNLIFRLFVLGVFIFPAAASAQPGDSLQAIDRLAEVKIYFDIKADSAAKLEKRLIWINETYEQARQRGVKATFIIAIRGPASFFVTRGDEYVDEKEIPTKEKIKKWLHYFASRGVPIEQCGLSAELFDIDPNDFFPQLTVVKNGYLSMAGYQNKGYAYVPM